MKLIKNLMFCIIFVPFAVNAFEYEEPISNPELENRAKNLFAIVRCVTCVSQSIADSEADLAKDLRKLIRNKVSSGESDENIKSYLIERYGKQILLSPPVEKSTYILWLTPWILVIIGIIVLSRLVRKKPTKK